MPKDDDLEPGWGGLMFFLWPIGVYLRLKQWVHDKLHPKDKD